jgi:RNA polymerase sigma factor (sigma-70 family)
MDTEKLILEYLPLVNLIARDFGALGRDPDIIQCGRIGLWQAAEKWDGKRDFKPFAKVCIRHAIIDQLKRAQRWEPAVDIFDDVGVEDERDLVGAIKHRFRAGTQEREILLGLLRGVPKQDLADRFNTTRRGITKIARDAWENLDK